jgi:hypothetical protein
MSELMTKAAFARLCQISQPMLSPGKYGPYLVMERGKVDARASLTALEGRLDTAKWTDARDKLDAAEKAGPPPLAAVADKAGTDGDGEHGDASEIAEPQGWKARRDKFAALTAEVDYLKLVGALVDATEIGAGIEAIIADFCTVSEQSLKLDAAEIASELKLDVDGAAKLRSMLIKRHRDMRANLSRRLRETEKRFLAESQGVA